MVPRLGRRHLLADASLKTGARHRHTDYWAADACYGRWRWIYQVDPKRATSVGPCYDCPPLRMISTSVRRVKGQQEQEETVTWL